MKPAAALLLALAFSAVPYHAFAGGPAPSNCPAGRFCEPHLGISLRLPHGWFVVGTKQLAGSNQVAFAAPGGGGLSYNLRLIARAFAVTSFTNSRQSAEHVAAKLITAERIPEAFQSPVHYAGTFGLIIGGLPGGPTPALDLILARHQFVYQIILPGRKLAPDQRAALRSLRFIPRVGPFLGAHG